LGLGSIEISPELVVSDRKKRYQSLFEGNEWTLPNFTKNHSEFISEFERFILSNLNEADKEKSSSLWETYRLKQLKNMLDFEKGKLLNEQGKIEYMEIKHPYKGNEFKDRKVLPIPEKV